MTKKTKDIFNVLRIDLLQKSPFYKFCLDKRWNIFASEKFITEPWAGSSVVGKSILDGNLFLKFSQYPIDVLNTILKKKEESGIEFEYIYSFSWLRDLQAIGGNYSRRYARKAISEFIEIYQSSNSFWIEKFSWQPTIVSERIVNWIMSYSFFASGASDKFQRTVLSAINQQFSHLFKIYKAELNPYAKMFVLKAILFCLVAMKHNQFRNIKKILQELQKLISENFDADGMFYSKNPVDHFNMFRCLLETRFMTKKNNIDFAQSMFEKLPNMAACVRFLRLGDGLCSEHCGGKQTESFLFPTQHMIDTALSLVEIDNKNNKSIPGFERLSTKETTLLINTEVSDIRSKFNSDAEPGINIFDFEASFGTNRLINRSDVSILFNNFRVKADKTFDCFFEKNIAGELCFDGETQTTHQFFSFAMRRKINLSFDKQKISSTDIAYISGEFQAFFRLVLYQNSEIEKISAKKFLISINKKEFLFNINETSSTAEITVHDDELYPSIETSINGAKGKEALLSWSIEEVLA